MARAEPVGAGWPGLTRALARNAERQGGATALIDGGRVLTWGEFRDRVARLAGGLRGLGVSPGGRVAILAQNSHQIAESVFAALWSGAVAFPLNHRLAVPELAAQFGECTPSVLLAHGDFLGIARALPLPAGARIVAFEAEPAADLVDYEALIADAAPIPDAGARDEDTALLVYTGGTTGRSKGVMLTHANLWANAFNVNSSARLGAEHPYMLASPLFHVSALARMVSTMAAGAPLVFLRRFTAEAALEAIATHRVAITTLVPTMIKAVVEHPELERHDLSSLRFLCYGAAAADETLLRTAMARLPHVAFWQAYGMTEVSPTATQLSDAEHRAEGGRWLRSAGRAALLCEVAVTGADDEIVPAGKVGEVCVRGPNVMKGYWGRPDLTAWTLRGGWMHTGDLGYLDEAGFLFVVDRKDDMIVSGGENVYTTEVENAVASHPAVGQCAVVGLSDPTWGQIVHAVVIPAAGATLTLEELRGHCRPLIAGYKLPRSLEIRREPLPLSGVNKVVKARLKAEAEARRATEQTR